MVDRQLTEATQELAADLTAALRGEVRLDRMTRQLYSTDASSFRIVPIGVVLPGDADDVAAAVEVAARHGVPLVPRGGGTSLSGQTIGPALILDHSRYLDRVLELNPEEGWVRAQSGLVLDHLNAALAPWGLMVGPDPASSMAATLGGMAGNNSTGSHSIRYGMMVDYVREVEVVLSDGSRHRFGPCNAREVESLARKVSLEGRLYRQIPALVERYREEIESRFPRIWRSVAGYNLHRVLAQQRGGEPLNLAPLIVGSEGTLAVITSVTLGLVPRPRRTRLAVVHFDTLRSALETVPLLLESQPAAIELVDRFFLRLTRTVPEYAARLTFVEGDPGAVLLVEFAGDDEAALASQARALEAQLRGGGYCLAVVHQVTLEEIANVWAVRKAGLGLLMSQRGDAKPLAFVDDATVPVEHLAGYAAEVERVCRDLGTEAAFYAHASAGCLHINPMINLKSVQGLEQMRVISEEVARLAIAHGGTTTGEHGEGLARSYFNSALFGPALHQGFRELKALFDPDSRLNPGKIVDAPAPWDPAHLRFSPSYRTPLAPRATLLDFSADGGMAGLVEMCNGQGVCRKRGAGTMCPSFMATRDEAHSTRGRANALRAAMTGELGPEGLASEALHEVLDLCLECKGCKRECPSLVDMAKLKYEFLAHYQAVHGVPLRSRLFANVATINRLGSFLPGLTNRGLRSPAVRRVLDRFLGIDQRRTLPALANHTFRSWFNERPPSPPAPRGPVILWDDTYLSYNEPEVGKAAVRLLEAAGFEVRLIAGRRCCARPMISKGLLKEARAHAAHNVALLAPHAAEGVPIVGLEPSCLTTLRDEYPDLLRGDDARAVARQSVFIEEFLAALAEQGELDLPFAPVEAARDVLVHGHCYQKAITGMGPLLSLLRLLPDTSVQEIPSGCCGMAGAFGYEREHYDVSLACGEDRLFPAVREARESTVIVASGISCRQQIAHGTGRRAIHPVVFLASMLEQTATLVPVVAGEAMSGYG